jgi:hypothetical protein
MKSFASIGHAIALGIAILLGMLAELITAGHAHANADTVPLQDGDIIFQTSQSTQSGAVQRATRSRYSHTALVFIQQGAPVLLEASGTVHYTPLEKWIQLGEGQHFVVKRLRDADRILTPEGLQKLRQAAREFEGKPYDRTFEWSDDRIYCSELVWKVYNRALGIQLGDPQKLREFNLADPVVKQLLEERYGNHIPLNETVISPGAIFDSTNLVTVIQR